MNFMTPDLSRLLLYLGVGLISFSIIILVVARKIRSGFKLISKKTIWYLLAAMAVFTAFLAGFGGSLGIVREIA